MPWYLLTISTQECRIAIEGASLNIRSGIGTLNFEFTIVGNGDGKRSIALHIPKSYIQCGATCKQQSDRHDTHDRSRRRHGGGGSEWIMRQKF
jgi:hypothetical protein